MFIVILIFDFYKGFVLKNDLFEKQFFGFCEVVVEDSVIGLFIVYKKICWLIFVCLRFQQNKYVCFFRGILYYLF